MTSTNSCCTGRRSPSLPPRHPSGPHTSWPQFFWVCPPHFGLLVGSLTIENTPLLLLTFPNFCIAFVAFVLVQPSIAGFSCGIVFPVVRVAFDCNSCCCFAFSLLLLLSRCCCCFLVAFSLLSRCFLVAVAAAACLLTMSCFTTAVPASTSCSPLLARTPQTQLGCPYPTRSQSCYTGISELHAEIAIRTPTPALQLRLDSFTECRSFCCNSDTNINTTRIVRCLPRQEGWLLSV